MKKAKEPKLKDLTLSVCLIVKDESLNIKRCLASVLNYVDEVCVTDTGSTDDTIEIIEDICKRASKKLVLTKLTKERNSEFFLDTEWDGEKYTDLDFPKARNYNFATATSDYTLWLDADDTFEGAAGLPVAIRLMESRGITDIGVNYWYEVDEKGEPVTIHAKERVVKTGYYMWEGLPANQVNGEEVWKVHENLYPKQGNKKLSAFDQNMHIRHWIDEADKEQSNSRNARILKYMLVKMGENPDPRAVFLYGRELYGLHKFVESEYHLSAYLSMVGNIGDRALACTMLVDIQLALGEYQKALNFGLEGIKSRP